MHIARFTRPRITHQAGHKWAIGTLDQTGYHRLGLVRIGQLAQPAAARAQFAGGLWAAQQQHTYDADLLPGELQAAEAHVPEAVLILGHPAAESPTVADQVPLDQAVDRLLYLGIAQLHHRIAAALLVTGSGKCAQ